MEWWALEEGGGSGGGGGGGVESCGEHTTEFKRELRVLLVDHDQQFLSYLVPLLHSCSYNVTAVEHASTALQILTEGRLEFDLLIADICLADVDALTLLRLAEKMGLLAMLMTAKLDPSLQHRALYNGALLLLEKPMTRESLKYLSQIVMKEKMRSYNTSERERLKLAEAMRVEEINRRNVTTLDGNITPMEDNRINNGTNPAPKKRGRKPKKVNECNEYQNLIGKGKLKRKVCTEWTEELHEKFMDAVRSLGEGKIENVLGKCVGCYPTDILERMNVTGLTRMQVASHLQKCRNDNWKTVERKAKGSLKKSEPRVPYKVHDNGVIPKSVDKKFGSMPFKNPSDHANPFEPSNDPPQNSPTPPNNNTTPQDIDMDPILPPQPQDPTQPFGTHQQIPYHAQNQIMEQTQEFVPLGSLSMSDNGSKNLSAGTVNFDDPFEMSDLNNASKNVTVGTVNFNNPFEMSNLKSDNASNSVTVGTVNFGNPFEMTSLNRVHEKLVAPMDLTMAPPGNDPLASSSSHQKTLQSSNEFIYINPEMDEYIRNFAGQDDGLTNYNHNVRTQHACDFDPDFPNQFSLGPNGQEPGQ